ncbi:hypothetical protein [Halobacillus sp. B23F22_1]|uniref:hypothetical protein n=1 Tax=Halobacillus sp. B23F22_1 TaxID=3459514 RepID=UPI00373E5A97
MLGLFLITGGGLILGLGLFGVGVVIALVLYETARLAFYHELLQKKRQNEWRAKVEEAQAT